MQKAKCKSKNPLPRRSAHRRHGEVARRSRWSGIVPFHYPLTTEFMSFRIVWRKSVNVVMLSLTGVCALVTVSALFFILGYLLWYGGKSLNWAFFTQLPVPVGETGGGMANAIVGSGKLLLLASLLGIPVGLLGGVYL